MSGRIVKSGGKELALELEEKGYDWVTEGAGYRPRLEQLRDTGAGDSAETER